MARLIQAVKDICSGQFAAGHGKSKSPEYKAWANAIYRCENENAQQWPLYGARGIKVCGRWRMSFEAFLHDIGPRPSPKHSLERRDVNGDYEPSNCLWATAKDQANNRQSTKRIGGMSPMQLAEATGLPYNTVKNRIRRGWPEERILAQPRRSYGGTRNVDC